MKKLILAFSIKGEEENAGRMEWAETSVRADLWQKDSRKTERVE